MLKHQIELEETYLNLNLKLYTKEGQEVKAQKSTYCLIREKNLHIIE